MCDQATQNKQLSNEGLISKLSDFDSWNFLQSFFKNNKILFFGN